MVNFSLQIELPTKKIDYWTSTFGNQKKINVLDNFSKKYVCLCPSRINN